MTNLNTPPAPPPVNAEALLTVSFDGLEASIRIKPPENGGADLSYGLLKVFLAKNRIVFGLDDEVLQSLGAKPIYNKDFIIARGIRSENGTDAELIYHVETDRQLKPKERADGSVDFKDLGAIQEVKKGQILCEKIPAVLGKQGTDVKGLKLPFIEGKDKELPAGKNTKASDDALKLFAELDGHVSVAGGKINVMDTFMVDGNVSVETGNIDFTGSVVIRGDVALGFSVKASGDVTIEGVVEAAHIIAGGSLVIRGGFLGGDSGILDVGENAVCRFIEGGKISVKGNLETTYIMNAVVKCGGAVNLTGKGLIRGGHVSARTSITANLLGSAKSSSASTVVEIGNDPFLVERRAALVKESDAHEKNIAGLKAMIAPLEKAKQSGSLTRDRATQLEKAVTLSGILQAQLKAAKEELGKLEAQLEDMGRGTLNVQRTAYAGLKIIIGKEALLLQTEHDRVSFYVGQDGITFTPLAK